MNALIFSLPKRDSTLRMRVWRALKDNGCAVLRDGVYVAPAASKALSQVEADIRAAGGFAMATELTLRSAEQQAHVRSLFDRGAEYGALVKKIGAVRTALPQLGARKAHTALRRLQRAFDKLAEIDFFPGEARSQAAEALAALKRRHAELYAGREPHPSRKRIRAVNAARYQKRLWATRKEPWVDRLASAWLIKRFIDADARFVWIGEPRERPKKAVGFDFDGAEFTHAGNRVTFEVLLASFSLEHDAALAAIGAAVHFLDVGGIPVADAKGLETVLRGIKEKARSDDALLAEAMRIFDHFYKAYSNSGN
jgi:hypothetical protein